MINPSEAIAEFFDYVSWSGECLTLPDPTGSPYLVCGLYTLLPCHWSEYEQKKALAIALASRWDIKPGFILYGDCPSYDCDRLNYELGQAGFVTYWLGVEEQISQSQFLMRSFDGVNFIKLAYPSL